MTHRRFQPNNCADEVALDCFATAPGAIRCIDVSESKCSFKDSDRRSIWLKKFSRSQITALQLKVRSWFTEDLFNFCIYRRLARILLKYSEYKKGTMGMNVGNHPAGGQMNCPGRNMIVLHRIITDVVNQYLAESELTSWHY